MVLKEVVKSIPMKTNLLVPVPVPVPAYFMCPISHDLMQDPVITSAGITYDRKSIETWLEMGNSRCPIINQNVSQDELIPNHSLRRLIQDWCVSNQASGVERIPTPRIPLNKTQTLQILNEVSSYSSRGDGVRCGELATKLRGLGKESKSNRRCVVSCGGSRVLSSAFREFSGEGIDRSTLVILEEILSSLVCFFPLDKEARQNLCSHGTLRSIVSILNQGNLAGRINAVKLLKEITSSSDIEAIGSVGKTYGLPEALTKLVEKPISIEATKAALVTIYYLLLVSERIASDFADFGLVSSLMEILVDCDKSMCEKALGVLEGMFSSKRGREMGCKHALTVPILVRKLTCNSQLATDFSIAALAKLCTNCKKENCCVVEVLKAGGFQNVLILLQLSRNRKTIEKARDLLHLLNGSRMNVQCIESGIKMPF